MTRTASAKNELVSASAKNELVLRFSYSAGYLANMLIV